MKKVLVWDCFPLKNIGGPMGYCFNIHEYLKTHPTDQITFLSDLYTDKSNEIKDDILPLKSDESFFMTLKEIVKLCFFSRRNKMLLPENINFNDYDYIHFHWSRNILSTKKILSNYKGKTILTTHCPCPVTDEFLSKRPKFWKIFRPTLLRKEIQAFKESDYLMFPVEGAREPYEKDRQIKQFFSINEDKFFYCPSSIVDIFIDEDKIQKIKELGIPENSFVVTYFGRHTYIKGYDILKRIGEDLLEKYPNLYFLCAGNGEIEPFHHERWIELGFIHNTHELLWQSDLYILPNRETYFDLVVLEILRSGTPLLLAANGGNNYFKQFPNEEITGLGFFEVNNYDEIKLKVESMILKKNNEEENYQSLGAANRLLWKKYFTIDSYISRYLACLEKL